MPRFFIDTPPAGSSVIHLGGENGRHISRSLRMKKGELLTLCDGHGTDYTCELQSFTEETAVAVILSCAPSRSEPLTQIHLYQSIPKADKLETIIQKVTELGAASVTPVFSERCIARMTDKNTDKKLVRLQKIALEAAKQSGRGILPAVRPPLAFSAALKEAASMGGLLFFYEQGGLPLSVVAAQTGSVLSVFIGPEGGYSEREAALAAQAGACTVTLGRRILRTETAPLAAVSILLALKGDMQ